MIDRLETWRVYRATIPLSFLQISNLYTVPTRFYESLNGCVNYARFPKSGHINICQHDRTLVGKLAMSSVALHLVQMFLRGY